MEGVVEKTFKLIEEIRKTPIDKATYNSLFSWGVELSSCLIYLGQLEIKAKHSYWTKMSNIKQPNMAKAAAEIEANSTDEAKKYWLLNRLHEDAREMLMVIKKFMKVLEEEDEDSKYA